MALSPLATQDLPFGDELWAAWDRITEQGKDVRGIRALCLLDRYFLLVQMCSRRDMMHPWIYARCREVEAAPAGYIDLWAREHYKDLADDTPMLTENRGWTTHGELQVGDRVFAPSGKAVTVLAKTEQYLDSECYRVVFQDGAELIAGAGHLWRLRQKHRLRISGTNRREIAWGEVTVQTNQLCQYSERRDVGVCEPLEYPAQQLPIDPYLLGCWLGDGTSSTGTITCAYGDLELVEYLQDKITVDEVKSSNENTGLYRLDKGIQGKGGTGFTSVLRRQKLLNNKHIPALYFQSSIAQRMELLRGLMDTDGHCNDRGTATFVQVSKLLANQVYDLAVSLALRPHIRHYENDGNGFYQVSFQAHQDRNPFNLTRKSERAISPSEQRNCRNITQVIPVKSVPTHCIQVEGDMYLAGRTLVPTHNSSLITFGGAIQRILQNPEITIGIFSHVNSIASDFLRQIKVELEGNENLKRVFPDILWADPQKQASRWSVDGGIVVKRLSNPKEATVEASGLVDGMPTGKHYALRIYDDVVTDKSVATPEQIQKTTNAYSLSQSLGIVNGEEWMIGTRYSYADTYNWIIERGALTPRIYPATENGLRDGRLVYFTQAEWTKRLLKNTDGDIACQYMQNPLSGEQAMFDIADLQVYEVRPETLAVYVICDPARSKKKGSANTAIIVLGLDYAGNKYLLDGFNHKMDLQERWENFARMFLRWRLAPGVQQVRMGYESFGAQSDLDYFKEQMRMPGKPQFEVVELAWPRDTEGGKVDRVQRLVPDCKGHKIFLPYATESGQLTANQRQMEKSGYKYRIAASIRRKDENGNMYDLSEQLKMQFHYFPFGGLKDAIDAFARIYDMEPVTPRLNEPSYAEPEYA